jgi:Holliday junction resolvase-like predicted endonuclease
LGENRELELHEAWEVIAACFLPGIGLAIVHKYFFDHPELDLIVKDENTYPRYTREHQMKMQ